MRIILVFLAILFFIGGFAARVAPSVVFGFSGLFLALLGILDELVSIHRSINKNHKELLSVFIKENAE